MSLLKSLARLTNQLAFALAWRLTAFDASAIIDGGDHSSIQGRCANANTNTRLFSANEFQRNADHKVDSASLTDQNTSHSGELSYP